MPADVRASNPRIDLSRYELSLDGRRVKLERQPMELLIFFVQREGKLVTREDIVHLLWGNDVFVDVDSSINAAIRKIRWALKDDPTKPHYLETVVGKGYRLIARIELVGGPTLASAVLGEGAANSGTLPTARKGFGHWVWAGAASAIIAGLLILGWWLPKRLSTPSALRQTQIRAIAVLPFENLSGDPGQEYFAEGITDELTTDLAQVPSLQVISRTSAVQYRGAHKPTPQIGRELNVDAVVEGSVVRSGNHVRITAQLIEAHEDHHLWAQSFEGELRDVVSMQDDVARQVTEQISGRLSTADGTRMTAARAVDPAAYQDYLLGRYFWNKWTEEGIRKSIHYYEEAIKISPDYAPAYAGLADSYNSLSAMAIDNLPPTETSPKAKQAATRALQLDDTLAEAHGALGATLLFYEWDWAGAEKEIRRAITLNPNNATAHLWYSTYLLSMKRYDESLAEIHRALELDPLSIEMTAHLSWYYFLKHQFDQGASSARRAIEMDPNYVGGHFMLGLSLTKERKYDEAIKELKLALALSHGRRIILSALGNAYASAGNRREAERILNRLDQQHPSPNYEIAAIYSALGDRNLAFHYLQAALDARADAMLFLPNDPCMDPIRSDPRFAQLLGKLNLPVAGE